MTREIGRLPKRLFDAMALERLVGSDPAIEAVKQQVLRVAKADVTVLLTGETGTGKELTAQAIHYLSTRAGKPFVPVNCGAIPPHLLENEFFGHHQGAYTDARSNQPGLVAEGGEPRGALIKVGIGIVILALVLLWALARLRKGKRPNLPGAPQP